MLNRQTLARNLYRFALCLLALSACAGPAPSSDRLDADLPSERVAIVRENLSGGTILNTTLDGVTTVGWSSSHHETQTFYNYAMVQMNTLQVLVAGPMSFPSDTATLKLYDGCRNLLLTRSVSFTNSGIETASGSKYISFNVGTPLERGRYYQFEVSSTWGASSAGAKLTLNTDRFVWGRRYGNFVNLSFPEKKRDIVFYATGDVEYSGAPWPSTNVMCPAKCKIVRESSDPWWEFNVVVTENADPVGGSFWGDVNPSTMEVTSGLISKVSELFTNTASLPSVTPFNRYLGQDFWKQMNIYVAISSPAEDPWGALAQAYCANIDARADIVTNGIGYGSRPFGGATGQFWGQVARPRITAPEWTLWPASAAGSTGNYATLVHEVFGHGVGTLTDEYIARGTSVASTPVPHGGYQANSVPLTCEGLCESAKPVTELKLMMAGDVDAVCWDLTTAATCASPGGSAKCRWIGGLPAIPYWGGHQCIPSNVSQYNIGQRCAPNTGCYPLAPVGTSESAYMGVAQPASSIMQSFHGTSFPGFSGGVENYLTDMLDCVFTKTCHLYPSARCSAFQAKWGSPGSGWYSAFERANACDGTIYRRR